MMPSRVDVGRVIGEGAWSGYQKWIVLLVALTIIFDGIDNQLLGIGTPRAFSTAVLEFLLGEPDGSVETGTAVRRAVLGEAHVDRAAVSTTELTRDFQQLIAQFACPPLVAACLTASGQSRPDFKTTPEVPAMPKALMKLPRTPITRAKFPAIDFHLHGGQLRTAEDYQKMIAVMDQTGIGVICNMDGGFGATFDQQHEGRRALPRPHHPVRQDRLRGDQRTGLAGKDGRGARARLSGRRGGTEDQQGARARS